MNSSTLQLQSFPSRPLLTSLWTMAMALLMDATPLFAIEPPGKPFLDKTSFYLSSAGFRVNVANDPAMKKVMNALPPHRFVIHKTGSDVRYLYAEPKHCVCIFIGNQSAYQSYQDMIKPSGSLDLVEADYRSQARSLSTNPVDFNNLPDTTGMVDVLRLHY